jgi:hypothetical protein
MLRLKTVTIFSVILISLMSTARARGLPNFGLNDVSILLPIPNSLDSANFLNSDDEGPKGILLPKNVFDLFPSLLSTYSSDVLYPLFKAVSIRIDPCFNDGSDSICHKQIRFAWQPIVQNGASLTTLDSAAHTFYELNDTEWNAFLKQWAMLAEGNLVESLQIHPTLLREGYSGPFWERLKNTLLQFCGEKKLVRMTGMRNTENRIWTFMGFNRVGEHWQAMTIPFVTTPRQTFFFTTVGIQDLSEFQGRIAPEPNNSSLLSDLAKNSTLFKTTRPSSDLKNLMNYLVRVENPRLENSGTVDCVSCHVAQTALLWSERNLNAAHSVFRDSHRLEFRNLENNSVKPELTNRIRAFGYVGSEPMFSQRVINESASVSEQLSAKSKSCPPMRH